MRIVKRASSRKIKIFMSLHQVNNLRTQAYTHSQVNNPKIRVYSPIILKTLAQFLIVQKIPKDRRSHVIIIFLSLLTNI